MNRQEEVLPTLGAAAYVKARSGLMIITRAKTFEGGPYRGVQGRSGDICGKEKIVRKSVRCPSAFLDSHASGAARQWSNRSGIEDQERARIAAYGTVQMVERPRFESEAGETPN